jgi:putative aldouronate transport system permease protein
MNTQNYFTDRKKRAKLRHKRLRQSYQLYLVLLIPIAWVVVFMYFPMYGAQIAFRDFSIKYGGILESPWVGFKHFKIFFNSYMFKRVLTNTLRISLYSLIAGFPFPIAIALFINTLQNQKYKKTIQTILYIPHFISVIVMVAMLLQMFNARIGIYAILSKALTGSYPSNVFLEPSSFPHMYVWSGIWQEMGWNSIIYIAALSAIDEQLHEAAEIDGASRFKRMIHIDIPGILPTITILLILRAGTMLSVGFEKVFLMQNTANLSASEVISTYVYKVGLESGAGNFSYATAIGLFNSVVNMIILLLVNAFASKVSGTSLY